jgi:cytidylate kinase
MAPKALLDPNLAKLVEKQMRNWELSRAQRLSVPEPDRPEVEDFICISRSVGAGGKEIASMLGEKLGWPVFDKELLDVMAGDNDLRRSIYDSMDERDLGWFEESLRSMLQRDFVKNDYFHQLTETVLSLARQGHAVFLGRGTHLMLPAGIGLRVRIVAPHGACVEAFAKRTGQSIEEARASVKRLEKERIEFIQRHFKVDVDDPSRHDIVINRAQVGLKQAVEMILAARKIICGSREAT